MFGPNYTRDGHRAVVGQRVYGISPWGEIEVLYIQPDQISASTSSPSETSGADSCTFPLEQCWVDEDRALFEIYLQKEGRDFPGTQ